MSVWLSEMTSCAEVDGEQVVNIQTAIFNAQTDENGEVSFDLSGLNASEIIYVYPYAVQTGVTDILNLVDTRLTSVTTSAVTVVGLLANSLTMTVGAVLSAVTRCSLGVDIKLIVKYRK